MTTDSERVEAVARAIALSDYPDEILSWPTSFSERECEDYRANARAAIEALSSIPAQQEEVTPEMIEAGVDVAHDLLDGAPCSWPHSAFAMHVRAIYTAMQKARSAALRGDG